MSSVLPVARLARPAASRRKSNEPRPGGAIAPYQLLWPEYLQKPAVPLTSRQNIRIAYMTMRDPNDRRSWSGTLYCMARSLERNCGELFCVGPLLPPELKLGNVIRHAVKSFTGKNYLHTHTDFLSRKLGKMAKRKLATADCDVIVAVTASGIVPYLQTDLPIVYVADTTLRLMPGYYEEFTNAPRFQVRTAENLERLSIGKSAQLVYPSRWAADSAIRDYGANRLTTHVIPFGANLDDPPDRDLVLRQQASAECKLLFVGVDWQRKGGDVAFETLLKLEQAGVNCSLTIVGCTPPAGVSHPRLRVFPLLNKNNAAERAQFSKLYLDASFFILPTQADCFGVVFCEASAYGLPVLARATGGVPGAVRDGVNGFLFPGDARGVQYAEKIQALWHDKALYRALRLSAREEFESRLNWDAWGRCMKPVILRAFAEPQTVRGK